MRCALALPALLAAACTLYTDDDAPPTPEPSDRPSEMIGVRYELRPAGDFAAPTVAPVAAIAWDGTALWVVTNQDAAMYYDPDHVEIYRMGLDGTVLSGPIVLEDHHEAVVGAVWIEGTLWLSYSGGYGNVGFLRAIDLATGAELRVLGLPPYLADLERAGEHVAIAHAWNGFLDWSLDNGSVLANTQTPYFPGGDMFGLATTAAPGGAHETWLSDATMNELAIVSGGELVAYAVVGVVPAEWHRMGLPLQFAGDRLALAANNHVYLFDIER